MSKKTKTATVVNTDDIAALEAELAAKKAARAAALEKEREELNAKLSALHETVGLPDTAALIAALRRLGRKTGVGTRARISPEARAAVVAALKTGKTAKEVAAETGVSLPSVNLIKSKAGLTKPRKVDAVVDAAPAADVPADTTPAVE